MHSFSLLLFVFSLFISALSLPLTVVGQITGSSLFSPNSVCYSPNDGALYVLSLSQAIISVVYSSGIVRTFASGFKSPASIAFDTTNNALIMSDTNANTVYRYVNPAINAQATAFVTSIVQPTGVAAAAGNLYVLSLADGFVYRVAAGGTVLKLYTSGLASPRSIGVDLFNSFVYVTDAASQINRLALAGGASTSFASGFPCNGLYVDAVSVYCTDTQASRVRFISTTVLQAVFVNATFNGPTGIAYNSFNNTMIVANSATNSFTVLYPAAASYFRAPTGSKPNAAPVAILYSKFENVTYIATAINIYKMSQTGVVADFHVNSGQYSAIFGMTVSTTGVLYVSDSILGSVYYYATPASSNTRTLLASCLGCRGIAFNKGLVFAISSTDLRIYQMTTLGVSSQYTTAFASSTSIAVDSNGNFLVVENNNLVSINYGTALRTVIASGYSPLSVAVDAIGNIYTTEVGTNTVRVYLLGQTAPVLYTQNLLAPTALTFNNANNLMMASNSASPSYNYTNIALGRFDFSRTSLAITVPATGFKSTGGFALDAQQNVYTPTAAYSKSISFMAAGASGTDSLGSPLIYSLLGSITNPVSPVIDSAGNLYVADSTNIYKITPNGIVTLFSTGFTYNLNYLAIDSQDNIYAGSAFLMPVGSTQASLYVVSKYGGVPTRFGNPLLGLYNPPASNPMYNLMTQTISTFRQASARDSSGSNMYVATSSGILVYNMATSGPMTFYASLPTSFPIASLAVCSDGYLYATDTNTNNIYVINPDRSNAILATNSQAGSGLACRPGSPPTLYNTDIGNTNNLMLVSRTNGARTATLTTQLSAYIAGTSYPNRLVWDAAGNNLAICGSSNQLFLITYTAPSTFTVNNAYSGCGEVGLASAWVTGTYTSYFYAVQSTSTSTTVYRFTASGSRLAGYTFPAQIVMAHSWSDPATAGAPYTSVAINPNTGVFYQDSTLQPNTFKMAAASYLIPSCMTVFNGTLFMGSQLTGSIYQYSTTGDVTLIASGFPSPSGIAFYTNGDLYIASNATNSIYLVPYASRLSLAPTYSSAALSTSYIVATGFDNPQTLQFDRAGNLLVYNSGPDAIVRITI